MGSPYAGSVDVLENNSLKADGDAIPQGEVSAPLIIGTGAGSRFVDGAKGTITGTADLSQATGINIQELRRLISLQHIFEGDARHGTRYFERLESIFGIKDTMSRLDRPELIGKFKGMLNMEQVLQTSSTDATTPQGNEAAYSLTSGSKGQYMNYAVKEHGYIITVGCVRQDHTYSQGIHKM